MLLIPISQRPVCAVLPTFTPRVRCPFKSHGLKTAFASQGCAGGFKHTFTLLSTLWVLVPRTRETKKYLSRNSLHC